MKKRFKEIYEQYKDLFFIYFLLGIIFFPILIGLLIICERSKIVIAILSLVSLTSVFFASLLFINKFNKKKSAALILLLLLIITLIPSSIVLYENTHTDKVLIQLHETFDTLNLANLYRIPNPNRQLFDRLSKVYSEGRKQLKRGLYYICDKYSEEDEYLDYINTLLNGFVFYEKPFASYNQTLYRDTINYWYYYNLLRHKFDNLDLNSYMKFINDYYYPQLKDTAEKYLDSLINKLLDLLKESNTDINKKLFKELLIYIKNKRDNNVNLYYKTKFSHYAVMREFLKYQSYLNYQGPLKKASELAFNKDNIFNINYYIENSEYFYDSNKANIYIELNFYLTYRKYRFLYNLKASGYAYINGKKFYLKTIHLKDYYSVYRLIYDFNYISYKLFKQ